MILNTFRTVVTPLQKSDLDEILRMYQEPHSFKFIMPLQNKTPAFYKEFLQKKMILNQSEMGFWVVRNKGAFVGTVNLNFFMQTSFLQIGCHLSAPFWNQGYATELMHELIRYAFVDRVLNEVFGVFDMDNKVSKKLLERLGFCPFEKRILEDSTVWIYKLENRKSSL